MIAENPAMARALAFCASGSGVAALAWGYWEEGNAGGALALVLFRMLWLAAQWRWPAGRGWLSALGLLVTAGAAAVGLLSGAPDGLKIVMIAGALGGLLAWDLTDLDRRLSLAAPDDDLPACRAISRRHLAWLGLTAGAGLLLAAAAMSIPLRFSFVLTVFLTLAAILGVARLVFWLFRGH